MSPVTSNQQKHRDVTDESQAAPGAADPFADSDTETGLGHLGFQGSFFRSSHSALRHWR